MNDDLKQGGFYQFPLCLYARQCAFSDILNDCFHYGVIAVLDKLHDDDDEMCTFENRTAAEREEYFQRARDLVGFSRGDPDAFIVGEGRAERWLKTWTERYGKTCTVRLKTGFHFAARDNEEITEKELRVLVGIYSMIGAKPYAKVGWPMIQARAAGLMKPRQNTADSDRGPLYSRGQIERTLDELIARKFLSAFTHNKGERFWSHSLSPEELGEKVLRFKSWRKENLNARRQLNAEYTAKIQAALSDNERR